MDWEKIDQEINELSSDKKGKVRKNLVFSAKDAKEFEKLVGHGHFNAAIGILIKGFIEYKKKS